MGTRVWAAATLVLLAADVRPAPVGVPVCGTVPDCIARMREVADPSGGITDEEGAVAKALQSLSPESILPVMELRSSCLRDPTTSARARLRPRSSARLCELRDMLHAGRPSCLTR